MRRAALVVLLLGCVPAWPAAASEESQALSARGLIELNAGRTEQAMELFDRAIATGHGFREWIDHDGELDNLRGLPRFDEIMSRLGEAPAARQPATQA